MSRSNAYEFSSSPRRLHRSLERSWSVGGWLARLGLALVALTLLGAKVDAPFLPSEFEAADTVGIEQIGRDVFAFTAFGGAPASIHLESGENVVFTTARGRLGLVLTDRRALAVGTLGSFRELRYGVQESRPLTTILENRVALLVTDRRILGFVDDGGGWSEVGVGPQEVVAAVRVGSGSAIVVTNRRAIGLSPEAGGFLETSLGVQERVLSVRVSDTIGSITTDRRVLVFSAPTGTWKSSKRTLN